MSSNQNDTNDTNATTTNSNNNNKPNEVIDVNYVIDEELENSYMVRKELSEKYGKHFSRKMIHESYQAMFEVLEQNENNDAIEEKELEEKLQEVFIKNLKKKNYGDDVLITHLDNIISYIYLDGGIFEHIVDDDKSFNYFKNIFNRYENILEIEKALNTITSQKQRLPFAFISVHNRCQNGNYVKIKFHIEQEYIEKTEEYLRSILSSRN